MQREVAMKIRGVLVSCVIAMLVLIAQARASILIETVTANGTVSGTSITYTVSNTGGSPRAVFFPAQTDAGTWEWQNNFPEFGPPGGPPIPPQTLREDETPSPNAEECVVRHESAQNSRQS